MDGDGLLDRRVNARIQNHAAILLGKTFPASIILFANEEIYQNINYLYFCNVTHNNKCPRKNVWF